MQNHVKSKRGTKISQLCISTPLPSILDPPLHYAGFSLGIIGIPSDGELCDSREGVANTSACAGRRMTQHLDLLPLHSTIEMAVSGTKKICYIS